jgi:formylmethanofuran dehydrogenase subunit E-like metal-binding protein
MRFGAQPGKIFMTETPVVVQKTYEFNLWMIQKAASFPRSYKFSIGDRLVDGVIGILMRLVDAAYARDKEKPLSEVNAMLNQLRFLLRLAKDLKLLTVDSYGYASENVEEIGRMAGGWRKSVAPAAAK